MNQKCILLRVARPEDVAKAVDLVNSGKSYGDAAKALGKDKSTVWRWVHDPERYGYKAPEPTTPSDHGSGATSDPEPAPQPVQQPEQPPAPAAPARIPATSSWSMEGFTPTVVGIGPHKDDEDAVTLPVAPEKRPEPTPSELAEAKVLVGVVVKIADRRLTGAGADAISSMEHDALVEAWRPIVARWLVGPEAPLIVACVVTGGVLGPRIAQVRKHRGDRPDRPDRPERVKNEPEDRGTSALHARLRNEVVD